MGVLDGKIFDNLEIELFNKKSELLDWYIEELSLFEGKTRKDIKKIRELKGFYGIGIGF